MMMIPSELIETLSTVVKEGTFDAAARTLHVTPSAVSQRIKALEQRVGRVLVVRSKPVQATEAGEALLRLGQQLTLLETETLRQLGTERDDERPTTLPIAVNADSLATWILPRSRESRPASRSSSTSSATTRTTPRDCWRQAPSWQRWPVTPCPSPAARRPHWDG